jgi:hypothetical protein
MTRGPIWLALMTVAAMWALPVPAFAQAEDSEQLHCPAGYSLVDEECVNSDGDVVKPQ